jgi:thiol-disulfide isomerase/thioredoxin
MMKRIQLLCVFPALLVLLPVLCRAAGSEAEQRVLDYLREHVKPGHPLIVSDLYNRVFTQPAERQALNKLYNSFFRIPLFVAEYQQKFGAPPTLDVIAQQFDLASPRDADVLLRVMEDDPRVPPFMTRDSKTGEITKVDVAAIKADARFGRVVDRHLGGLEGVPAPEFKLPGIGGGDVDLQSLKGKTVLLYVWFTGCPPCMKETPELVKLDLEYRRKGLAVVGANADRVLGLEYDDAVRRRYIEEKHITFPVGHWTREGDSAYGNISIYPTLFLIALDGDIRRHWVGYTAGEELNRAILKELPAAPASGASQN